VVGVSGADLSEKAADLCAALGPVEAAFAALPFPPFSAIRRLIDAGVPARSVGALHGDHALKVARVNVRGRRWEPEGPDPRLLIGVRDGSGTMIDVIAIARHAPADWALMTGEAAMLGEDTLDDAARDVMAHGRARMRLHGDPWGWLVSGCEGLCVLDWNVAAPSIRMLGESVTIVTDGGASRGTLARLSRGGLPRVAEVQADDAGLSLAEKFGRRKAA